MSSSYQNNNFTPIIGILCIDISSDLRKAYGNDYYSYISASYVDYLESAGAQVIPIWINQPRSYYENIMDKINGVLLPGGAVYFDTKYCNDGMRSDCVQSSKYIFEIAKELNEKGKHFPLWGTCLGFQLMLTHSADVIDIRRDCKLMDCSLPVELESDKVLASSKLFGHLDDALKIKMSSLPFGVHFHKYCITKEDLQIFKIDQQWKVLACNEDENGMEFINIVEHKRLPFYGSQIHPERVVIDSFMPKSSNNHCLECFELAQYFGKFFVQQCSLNKNRFANQMEISRHTIQNFPVIDHATAETKVFRYYYIFKMDADYPEEPLKT